nr:putative cytochrome P450 cyp-13B1 [Dermacentor andersoni]
MLSTFVALLALFSAFLFRWMRRTFTFWNGRGVAHLTFWQYLRFVYDIYTKPVNEVIRRSYNRYGRVYGSYQGTVPTLVVGDPDILREVLTTKFQNFADRTVSIARTRSSKFPRCQSGK